MSQIKVLKVRLTAKKADDVAVEQNEHKAKSNWTFTPSTFPIRRPQRGKDKKK
jgi:hypothetical protein